MTSAVEYTVLKVSALGQEEPLSSGHFEVGRDYGAPGHPVVFFPDEITAKAAAVEYAVKIAAIDFPSRFVVRRTETRIVWDES